MLNHGGSVYPNISPIIDHMIKMKIRFFIFLRVKYTLFKNLEDLSSMANISKIKYKILSFELYTFLGIFQYNFKQFQHFIR